MIWSYLVVALAVVALFHVFVYHRYNWPSYVRTINRIPGPPGVFFFGNTLKYYMLKHEEILPDIINDFKTYGPTMRYWYSGIAVVFLSELEDIQAVLSSRLNNSKGILYWYILPWLGTGLLTSSGEKWHKMRKIITPTFHFSVLQGYIDVFNKNARVLVDLLRREVDKDEVDLAHRVTHCALDIICETAMGVTLNSQTTGAESKYVQAIFRLGKIIVDRLFSPMYFTAHNFALCPTGWEHSRMLKTLHGFTTRIIKEKKELQGMKKAETGLTEVTSNAYGSTTKKSFLEMLLENQETYSLTETAIREEVDTFTFEGHDTTSASIVWTLFELGHNQAIQEKVHDELYQIFGDSDRDPTHNDLMQMTYLKRVIQEALRLYPSVPVISRKFEVDFKTRNYVIPANTEIVLVLYYIHRNPKVFPEPDTFDPDRFLPEAAEKRHPFAYVPFSAGQRNCIGQKFAMLEELVILSSIIRSFKVYSLDERESVKVVPELILRPSTDLRWRLVKRQSSSG